MVAHCLAGDFLASIVVLEGERVLRLRTFVGDLRDIREGWRGAHDDFNFCHSSVSVSNRILRHGKALSWSGFKHTKSLRDCHQLRRAPSRLRTIAALRQCPAALSNTE